ncbi:galanin receptor type 1-like [Exaiptasia diaphana]|uniref:G-protein coupled receptors family 1 profile domain-containing protein n=1 Tax=Exaiptasia diaphana TaxID=2652724 RepID=A0A913X831_EXADI|nr:galanin receptor type 1-like [Exaiptasia diaphana]
MANNTSFHEGFSCQPLSPTSAVIIGKIWAYSILIPASLFGNILTIVVIYANKNLRRPLDFFIMNMAISNLFIPCVVLPYQIVKTANNANYWLVDGLVGEFMCKFVFILADMCPVVSIYSLIGMTGERFVAVIYGTKAPRNSITRRIVLIWILSFILFTPYFYTFRLHRLNNNWYCLQRWSPLLDHVAAYRIHMTILVVVCIILPFCLLTAMYAVILITLTKCLPYFKPESKNGRERRYKAIRSTITQALALVAVFGLCWGPYNVMVLVWGFVWNWSNFPSCDVRLLFICAQFMTYSDSCVSPSVYFIFFPRYKRAMKRVFNCRSVK